MSDGLPKIIKMLLTAFFTRVIVRIYSVFSADTCDLINNERIIMYLNVFLFNSEVLSDTLGSDSPATTSEAQPDAGVVQSLADAIRSRDFSKVQEELGKGTEAEKKALANVTMVALYCT